MPPIRITPVVLNLIIINVIMFIAKEINPELLTPFLHLVKLNPFGWHDTFEIGGQTWYKFVMDGQLYRAEGPSFFMPLQVLTSFFSHSDLMHIAANMFVLFQTGVMLETVMKPKRFLALALTIGLVGNLICVFFDPSPVPSWGASGMTAGLTVVFAYFFPQTRLGFFFLPISFPIKRFVLGFAVISLVLVIVGAVTQRSMGGISHFGHLAGMAVGFAYLHIGKLRKLVKM